MSSFEDFVKLVFDKPKTAKCWDSTRRQWVYMHTFDAPVVSDWQRRQWEEGDWDLCAESREENKP